MMTTVSPSKSHGGVSRGVIAAAVTGTFALALGAFLLSFGALQDLARLAGIPGGQAWLWPLIVDGVILQATISVVALRDAASSARRFAWMLLVAGTGVSVAANITHAVLTADERVPGLVAALVASVPPLVLVAMTHLTVELIRNAAPRHDEGSAPDPRSVVITTHRVPAPPALEADTDPDDAAQQGADAREDMAGQLVAAVPVPAGRQERIREAARLSAQHVPNREIARRFGVHPTTVARWLNAPAPSHERNDDESDTEQP